MSLNDRDFPVEIDTDAGDATKLFFTPCLKESLYYDLAVGYFTSDWIRNAAEGIATFASNGGHARWVISPDLNEEDWRVICNPDPPDSAEIEKIFSQSIDRIIDALRTHTRDMLCYLISDKILEFKLAVPTKSPGAGIFHPKRGVFTDAEGNSVSFIGSYNSTSAAENSNWESFAIATSWDDLKRVEVARGVFERIWNKDSPNLAVYDPTEVIIKKISDKKTSTRPYKIEIITSPDRKIAKPSDLDIREYQQHAINEWFNNNGKGMYIMATGTGKTITALATIEQLFASLKEKNIKLFVLIVVPYLHLIEQWTEECKKFGIYPTKCMDLEETWAPKLIEQISSLNLGVIDNLFVISTNTTFKLDKLQEIIKSISTNFLFVADEAHHLATDKAKKKLPKNAKFRLGLTATPGSDDEYDDTDILYEYFGEPVIEFLIDKAIKDDYLCEYYYHPILCHLDEEESDNYKVICRQLAQALAQSPKKLSNRAKKLINTRSQILSLVKEKLINLESLLKKNYPSKHNLIYCGAAKDSENSERHIEFERHIEKVLNIAGNKVGMKIRKFTQDEDRETRKKILSDFSDGELDAIAAIKCLDEGVDVPKTQNAYILASSRNPREFIQRRGRVLRKAEGKKYAYIYDFICFPIDSHLISINEFNTERKLLASELKRANEFAQSARNSGEALKVLRPIKEKYNLVDY